MSHVSRTNWPTPTNPARKPNMKPNAAPPTDLEKTRATALARALIPLLARCTERLGELLRDDKRGVKP